MNGWMKRLEELLSRASGNIKPVIQGRMLVKVINIYDGVRRIRGREYIQSIITVPAEIRNTLFKRSNKFLAYIVLVDGKPALLLEPATPPSEEDIKEFLETLGEGQ